MMKIKCPRCGKEIIYAPENPHRPFCSERCKIFDLSKWANEEYRVATEDSSSQESKDLNAEDGEEV